MSARQAARRGSRLFPAGPVRLAGGDGVLVLSDASVREMAEAFIRREGVAVDPLSREPQQVDNNGGRAA